MNERKTVLLSVRVDEILHHQFITICKNQDKTASQVIREFMRNYVEKNKKDFEVAL